MIGRFHCGSKEWEKEFSGATGCKRLGKRSVLQIWMLYIILTHITTIRIFKINLENYAFTYLNNYALLTL